MFVRFRLSEHRNMPLQHSITLVATNFDEYIRKLKEKVAPAEEKEESTGIMEDVEPATSLILLNLAEGKAANLKQLEVVLNHILKLRDKLTGSDDSKRFHKILERLNAEDNGEIDPPGKIIFVFYFCQILINFVYLNFNSFNIINLQFNFNNLQKLRALFKINACACAVHVVYKYNMYYDYIALTIIFSYSTYIV